LKNRGIPLFLPLSPSTGWREREGEEEGEDEFKWIRV